VHFIDLTAIYSRGNGSVPIKIFYQLICSHEPIHLRRLTNYLQLRVFDCFWSLPASGHFLSLVTSCLWSLPVSGYFLSLVTSCLRSLPISGHFLPLVTFYLINYIYKFILSNNYSISKLIGSCEQLN
jgi:hypothetical protein